MNLADTMQLTQIQAGGSHPPQIYGTKASGFVKASEGECKCHKCDYYADDACNHPVVMADPEVKKNDHGDAIVADADRCKFWWPMSKGK